MLKKMPARDPDKVLVRFELPAAIWAESAHLVGDFNQWNEASCPLQRDRVDGTWHITLELERGRDYEFRYLINGGEWQNDWKADRYGPNAYGGSNSVVSTTALPSTEKKSEDIVHATLPTASVSRALQVG